MAQIVTPLFGNTIKVQAAPARTTLPISPPPDLINPPQIIECDTADTLVPSDSLSTAPAVTPTDTLVPADRSFMGTGALSSYVANCAVTITAGDALVGGDLGYTVEVIFTETTEPKAVDIFLLLQSMDTSTYLSNDGAVFPNGYPQDLAVFYNGAQVECDVRVCTTDVIQVDFRLRDPLAASASDAQYTVAWGNPTPTMMYHLNAVYLFGDDFVGASVDPGWVDRNLASATTQSNASLRVSPAGIAARACVQRILPSWYPSDLCLEADQLFFTDLFNWGDDEEWGIGLRYDPGNIDNAYEWVFHSQIGTHAYGPIFFQQDGTAVGSNISTTYVASDWHRLKLQAIGSGLQPLRAKVWEPDLAQPSAWQSNTWATTPASALSGLAMRLTSSDGTLGGGINAGNAQFRRVRLSRAVTNEPAITLGNPTFIGLAEADKLVPKDSATATLFVGISASAYSLAVTVTAADALTGLSGHGAGYTVIVDITGKIARDAFLGQFLQLTSDYHDAVKFPSGYPQDVRAYYNSRSIDADVLACTSTLLRVAFKLQANIGAAGVDAGYAVGWGDTVTAITQHDLLSVYLWGDDFAGSALGSAYSQQGASIAVSGNVAHVSNGSVSDPAWVMVSSLGTTALTAWVDLSLSVAQTSFTTQNSRAGIGIRYSAGNSYNLTIDGAGTDFLEDHVTFGTSFGATAIPAATWYTFKIRNPSAPFLATQGKFWPVTATEPAYTNNAVSSATDFAGDAAHLIAPIDNVNALTISYRYFRAIWAVTNEPTVTLGLLNPQYSASVDILVPRDTVVASAVLAASGSDALTPRDLFGGILLPAISDALQASDAGAFLPSVVFGDTLVPSDSLFTALISGIFIGGDTLVPADTGAAMLQAEQEDDLTQDVSAAETLNELGLGDTLTPGDAAGWSRFSGTADTLVPSDATSLFWIVIAGDSTFAQEIVMILGEIVALTLLPLAGDTLVPTEKAEAQWVRAISDTLVPSDAVALSPALAGSDSLGARDAALTLLLPLLSDTLTPQDLISSLALVVTAETTVPRDAILVSSFASAADAGATQDASVALLFPAPGDLLAVQETLAALLLSGSQDLVVPADTGTGAQAAMPQDRLVPADTTAALSVVPWLTFVYGPDAGVVAWFLPSSDVLVPSDLAVGTGTLTPGDTVLPGDLGLLTPYGASGDLLVPSDGLVSLLGESGGDTVPPADSAFLSLSQAVKDTLAVSESWTVALVGTPQDSLAPVESWAILLLPLSGDAVLPTDSLLGTLGLAMTDPLPVGDSGVLAALPSPGDSLVPGDLALALLVPVPADTLSAGEALTALLLESVAEVVVPSDAGVFLWPLLFLDALRPSDASSAVALAVALELVTPGETALALLLPLIAEALTPRDAVTVASSAVMADTGLVGETTTGVLGVVIAESLVPSDVGFLARAVPISDTVVPTDALAVWLVPSPRDPVTLRDTLAAVLLVLAGDRVIPGDKAVLFATVAPEREYLVLVTTRSTRYGVVDRPLLCAPAPRTALFAVPPP